MPRDYRLELDPRAARGNALTVRLRDPDPTLGWAGAPDLFAAWDAIQCRWQVWQDMDGTNSRLVAQGPIGGEHFDPAALIRELASRDRHARGHKDAIEEAIKANERLAAEKEKAQVEAMAETMDRVYHAAAGEIGHEYGYVAPISFAGLSLPADAAVVPEVA